MQVVENISGWLGSLIIASFVAAFFVAIGLSFPLYILGSDLDMFLLKEVIISFGVMWAKETYYIFYAMLIPALLISAKAKHKNGQASLTWYGVAGVFFGLVFFLGDWVFLGLGSILSHVSPPDWTWGFFSTNKLLITGIFVGGFLGGREFAKLRNGRLRWR